jgi:hypothetical protein
LGFKNGMENHRREMYVPKIKRQRIGGSEAHSKNLSCGDIRQSIAKKECVFISTVLVSLLSRHAIERRFQQRLPLQLPSSSKYTPFADSLFSPRVSLPPSVVHGRFPSARFCFRLAIFPGE